MNTGQGNETRPICKACERLRLPCQYGIRLLWQEEALSRGIALGRAGEPDKVTAIHVECLTKADRYQGVWSKKGRASTRKQHVITPSRLQNGRPNEDPYSPVQVPLAKDWIFLNYTYDDFQNTSNTDGTHYGAISDDSLPCVNHSLCQTVNLPTTARVLEESDRGLRGPLASAHQTEFNDCQHVVFEDDGLSVMSSLSARNQAEMGTGDDAVSAWPILQNPPPFALANNESYLLEYFIHGISPRCTTWPADDVYARNILPICMTSVHKPIFNMIMAVSSHQISILNRDTGSGKNTWIYHGKALRGLHTEIGQLQRQNGFSTDWEQVISTLVMVTFFDKELYRFFCAYFAHHDALNRTASALSDARDRRAAKWFKPELGLDMTVIDPLVGCSYELVQLISDISDVAAEVECQSPSSCIQETDCLSTYSPKQRLSRMQRRDSIERKLHTLAQKPPNASAPQKNVANNLIITEEVGCIAEIRRLSALMYLYSRIDGVPPGQPPINRLTDQILALIPKISLRSHALLWSLFVVGTMGLSKTEGDSGRKFILERLGENTLLAPS
ncbi:anaphase-promoting complex subunit 1 [Geosmithia morbida]|uniref:Anaphase-promoting complex subunit 1 n=1 Tax=Geosmithia morbida TaxID=1094350 RepID=A0A9P5D6V8_9HYPO|nr:anaphase-promoting complex subunit 1 [Geosmithia morbida]KAF4125986.1 anaphase-promoting complex subunit 1 [Geosmithia morbida]